MEPGEREDVKKFNKMCVQREYIFKNKKNIY